MVSIKSIYSYSIELAAFPDVLISFYRINNLSLGMAEIKILSNKPDIDHWLLVTGKEIPLEDMLHYFNNNAYMDMDQLFMMYTIIPARDRRILKRTMSGSVYYRSNYNNSLHYLKWVSAKYVFAGIDQILFIQSPILLFDSSVSSFFMNSWFSAFLSLLRTGVLNVVVNYTHFCLGTFNLNLCDLANK